MQNKSTTLHMSLLPIVVLVALILGAGYFLLAGDVKIPFLNDSNRIEVRRLTGFPLTVDTQKVMDKQRVVIKSQEELDAFIKATDDSGVLALTDPVDFSKEYLVAATSKTFTETGHSLKIKRVYDVSEDKKILVSIEQIDPDDLCIATEDKVTNVIVDMVSIQKTDLVIDFELQKKNDEQCEL